MPLHCGRIEFPPRDLADGMAEDADGEGDMAEDDMDDADVPAQSPRIQNKSATSTASPDYVKCQADLIKPTCQTKFWDALAATPKFSDSGVPNPELLVRLLNESFSFGGRIKVS